MKTPFLLFLTAVAGLAAGHQVVQIIPLIGEGGADALLVDSQARRLYVARADRLLVLDIDSGRTLAQIGDLPGIDGIAVARNINRGYVTNSRDNKVSIFELDQFGHLGQIPLGANPGALVYDSTAHRFYAMNRGSRNASAIDADDGEVEETIDLGGRPARAAADDHGKVFVALEDAGELVEIDAKKMKFSRRFRLPGCAGPHGIALDDGRKRLFLGCSGGRIAVVDANTGAVISTVAAGGSGGGDLAVDPSSGIVYVAHASGSVTLLADVGNAVYGVTETVPTTPGAKVIGFDATTRQLFVLAPAPGPAVDPSKPGSEKDASGSQLLVIR